MAALTVVAYPNATSSNATAGRMDKSSVTTTLIYFALLILIKVVKIFRAVRILVE